MPKPDSASYIYPVHSDPPAPEYSTNTIEEYARESRKTRIRHRWPFLLGLGLLLALLSGLVGGFVGKAIEHKKANHTALNDSRQSLNPNNPNNITTPANTTNTVNATLTIPSTGCPYTNMQVFQSDHTNVTYKVLCAVGWVDYDLFALSVATPSDCIETCMDYNDMIAGSNSEPGQMECVGGGFVPEFVNQTLAMNELDLPFNCWLKSSTKGLTNNTSRFQVVAICLNGRC